MYNGGPQTLHGLSGILATFNIAADGLNTDLTALTDFMCARQAPHLALSSQPSYKDVKSERCTLFSTPKVKDIPSQIKEARAGMGKYGTICELEDCGVIEIAKAEGPYVLKRCSRVSRQAVYTMLYHNIVQS